MQKHITFIVILFASWTITHSTAQNLEFTKTLSQNWAFIENEGQLADEKGNLLSDIRFYGKDKGVNVYCRQQSLSFVFTKSTYKEHNHTDANLTSKTRHPRLVNVDYARMDMYFVGSNPNAQITASKERSEYLNFYLPHTPEKGINKVPLFEKLTYKNLYPRIDLILSVKDQGLKYEFIIHPGGNPEDIRIQWEGTKPELLMNGGIKYMNELVIMHESKPFTFIDSTLEITSKFILDSENLLSFKLGKFDQSKTVVIDPTITWGTYYGGSDEDWGSGVSIDASRNICMVGVTASTSGIATSGAFQTSLAGNYDNYIAKFSENGGIVWATYFGGVSDDYLNNVTMDDSGNIFMLGYTWSNGMATSGAHQTSLGGNKDALIAAFNKSGSRSWSTYFGGSNADDGYDIFKVNSGNILLSGVTGSSSGIATSGAWQTSIGGGSDAFMAEFNQGGKLIWSSYFGGTGNEDGRGICADDSGNIFITGRTTSSSGIATSGAYQTSLGGKVDAFVTKFSSKGSRIWSTYFGGSENDFSEGISINSDSSVLISGETNSSSGIATSGAHQSTIGGGKDAFIAKFNNHGSMQWATYYGGSADDGSWDLYGDALDATYITGYTYSSSGIATSGAYQTSNGGLYDAFVSQFSKNGKLTKGTYYGGSWSDEGLAVAYKFSNLVITGQTASSSKIATSGAYNSTYSGGTDGFLAKFKFCTSTDSIIVKEACDSFILNNIIYRKSGTYTQTRTNSVQCDSTITLKLKILNSSSTIINTGCDSFVLNGISYKQSGTYYQKTKNYAGCDSTITIRLTLRSSTDTVIIQSACQSFTLNQQTYDSSGTYFQKLNNSRGCDSLITLSLTINGQTDTLLKQNACNYFLLNGDYYVTSGTYTQTLTGSQGCDSIINLELTILESTDSSISIIACDSLNLNGFTYKSSGTYFQTLTNAHGCDSILTLELKILRSTGSTIEQSACGSYNLNGISYNSSGTFIQKRSNFEGCDSTIKLNLTINNLPDARFNASIIKNDVTFTPFELNAKSYAWDFGNTSVSSLKSPVYRYPSIGNYRVLLKIISNHDCESQYDTTLSITSFGSIDPSSNIEISIVPNPAANEFVIYGLKEKALITIMDASGKIVHISDSTNESISVGHLSAGFYWVKISQGQMSITKKLMIE